MTIHEHADPPHPLRLLRPRSERPPRRAPKPRDEVPPSHPSSPEVDTGYPTAVGVAFMRGPNDGTATWSGHGSALDVSLLAVPPSE
jgi:hypothetical protein